ncbi:MAG: SsrA-binding protein, partial [Candidatus Electrothrix sp. LOE1_4_5]|nr:SsrA-binding protein [Candidatus Electrothrix gigas]
GEVFLYNIHISPYAFAVHSATDPLRVRKLLLHKREIRKLIGKLNEKGVALIPLKIYFIDNGKAKIELGLARGKKLYDKRAALKEKQSKRDVQRSLRQQYE